MVNVFHEAPVSSTWQKLFQTQPIRIKLFRFPSNLIGYFFLNIFKWIRIDRQCSWVPPTAPPFVTSLRPTTRARAGAPSSKRTRPCLEISITQKKKEKKKETIEKSIPFLFCSFFSLSSSFRWTHNKRRAPSPLAPRFYDCGPKNVRFSK